MAATVEGAQIITTHQAVVAMVEEVAQTDLVAEEAQKQMLILAHLALAVLGNLAGLVKLILAKFSSRQTLLIKS